MTSEHESGDDTHVVIPVSGNDEVVKIPIISELLIVAVILLLVFGGGVVAYFSDHDSDTVSVQPNTPTITTPPVIDTPEVVDPFANVLISAEAAFVFDAKTERVLYQKNADKQLPLASLTKLMTALVTYEVLGDEALVPITVAALAQDGNGLVGGEIFDRATLLDLVLLTSSNEGAFALAAAAGKAIAPNGDANTFVEAMNIMANELSLSQTYFRNPTGLDLSTTEAGAFGSARDVAFLTDHILNVYPAILEQTTKPYSYVENQSGTARTAYNTNQYVDEIPGIIGSKTGYTDLAGGNLAVAFNASLDRPIIIVVLGSTRSKRFSDTLTLVEAAQAAVQ